MTPEQLKLAMAQLLPRKIQVKSLAYKLHFPDEIRDSDKFVIKWVDGNTILETEWLYVMYLIEQTLSLQEHGEYVAMLKQDCSATFNQRATAMCELKGITP